MFLLVVKEVVGAVRFEQHQRTLIQRDVVGKMNPVVLQFVERLLVNGVPIYDDGGALTLLRYHTVRS